MSTQTTCVCGGTLPSNAQWCPRCLTPRPEDAPSTVAPAAAGHRSFLPLGGEPSPADADEAQPLPPGPGVRARTGRYDKTEASFGLTGRIVCTVLLLLPLAWFIYLATTMFVGIGGIVVYGGVVVPWALRDLWRHPNKR